MPSKTKKLLIAGGSHADIPVINAAKRLGFWVITSGNNPKDRGHAYSDEQYFVDYSEKKALLALARELGVHAILASANDFSALSCAFVAEQLNLQGHDSFEVAQTVHHKDKFREYALRIGLPVPKAIRVKDGAVDPEILSLRFPVLVKPVDLSGGKGITKVFDPVQLDGAIQKALAVTRSDVVVVEEFITGSNHGYSTFIQGGKVRFAFMDDEYYFVNPYLVAGASTSLKYTHEVAAKLNRALETLASDLGLCDGLLHVQFILRGEDPIIIEICRRTPGDLYVKLVEYATGFNMSEAIVKSACGLPVEDYSMGPIKYITRHCVMSKTEGIVDNVHYGSFKHRLFDKFVFFKPGERIENVMTYKAEIDFFQYDSAEDERESFTHLHQEVGIDFREETLI